MLTPKTLSRLPDESSKASHSSTKSFVTACSTTTQTNRQASVPQYKMAQVLKQTRECRKRLYLELLELDTEKTNKMSCSMFQQAAMDNGIIFDEQSTALIINQLCDNSGNLHYMKLIRDMVIRTNVNQSGQVFTKWTVKQCLQGMDKKKTIISDVVSLASGLSNCIPGEMDAATKKVIVAKVFNPETEKKFINLNSVSASCPIMNLPRNDYNHLYLQANQLSGYLQQNIHRIRTYLRETTNLQLQTLQDFAECFLKCDKQRSGQITRRAFILKLAKNNTQAPQHLMNNILQDIQLNQREAPTDNTILVYKHLIDIIEIFQHCPAILPIDSNKSTNFIHSLERLPMLKTIETYGRTDLLLQHVNNRILEKHKGFTEAFRRFDKNFDGSLNFREFVQGMGEMGLNLTLTDMRLLFDKIDFDKEGQIDYFKFCLLDYDKEQIRQNLVALQDDEEYKKQKLEKSGVNPRFRDGRLPKNKDQKQFLEECQESNKTKKYLDKKLLISATQENLKCAKDLINNHSFGIHSDNKHHNMQKLIQNGYINPQQELFDSVEENFKPDLAKYCLKPPKPTNASIRRDQQIKVQAANTIRPHSAAVKPSFTVDDLINQLWPQKQQISKIEAFNMCQLVMSRAFNVKLDMEAFNSAFSITYFDQTPSLDKQQIKSLVDNLQKIKKPRAVTKYKVALQKILKQFTPERLFDKNECSTIVDSIFKSKFQQNKFDAWLKEINKGKGSISVDQLTRIVVKMSMLPTEPKTHEFQSLLKSAKTPQLVKQAIDEIYNKFDKNGDNQLDIKEAKAFVDCVLINLYGEGKYSVRQFSDWFNQFDRDHSGFIDKAEIYDFIQKVAKMDQVGLRNVNTMYKDHIKDGNHHIEKLVGLYKSNQLDYLSICDLTRKFFRCFDLKGRASLGKVEMKSLLDCFQVQMNSIGTKMSKEGFAKWFSEIDGDGGGQITLDELIVALCKLLKIEMTKIDKTHNQVPLEIGQKNQMVMSSLKRFAVGQNDTNQVSSVLKMLWQQYNSDGHGFIVKSEAKHFVYKYFKYYCDVPQIIEDSTFDAWFRELDSDGDNLVSMIEIANALHKLKGQNKMQKTRSRSAQHLRVV